MSKCKQCKSMAHIVCHDGYCSIECLLARVRELEDALNIASKLIRKKAELEYEQREWPNKVRVFFNRMERLKENS